jgi:bifunctional DNA-binding transcriptional regulator/antitoxin component of YhaV-PrlF toxin-antitoxin module
MITTVTARGQVSIPSRLRKIAGITNGKHLHWYAVSEHEFRVIVENAGDAPGPLAALGWALRYRHGPVPSSDAAMRELREGDGV